MSGTTTSSSSDSWWKSGVVYQIYPASFQDSNDDGIGDLRGITQRLQYIKDLGATIIWICPMYDSPQHDMGYDIRDYKKVYEPYGNISDMTTLLSTAHSLGLKVLLDLVINHTSNEHAWFRESRSSRTSPKRDWYIWKPARYDAQGNRHPPNNWGSYFGGSTWEWDDLTQEYYLHLFAKEQPDFNFETAEARKALYADSIEFWLNLGVDGFRVDTCSLYSKNQNFPDAPIRDPAEEFQHAGATVNHGARIHEFMKEMGEIISRYDAMTVGECGDAGEVEHTLKYVSAKERELSSVFLFDVVNVGHGRPNRYTVPPRSWDLPTLMGAIEKTQRVFLGTDGWTTTFFENHDMARSISRFGDDSTPEAWSASGKMLAVMQATLSGTMYIYQGQEIGMINIPLTWPIPSEYKDIESQRWYDFLHQQFSSHKDPSKLALGILSMQHLARDNSRTPMQWTPDLPNAGFTGEHVKPWMRVNDGAATKERINVACQEGVEGSVLEFWKRMLRMRAERKEVFVFGEMELLEQERKNEKVMAFVKKSLSGDLVALVSCNFTGETQPLPHYEMAGEREVLVCSVEEPQENVLMPWEGRVVLIKSKK